MKYAIKVPVDDGWLYVTETDKDGNLIAKTFDTREEAEAFEAGAFNFDSLSQVVEYREDLVDTLTEEEIEELRAKKQAIKEELYDKVKMEMFEASSALEGSPPEEGITPDAWVIIEVNHEGEQFQKILAGWSGGYAYGNSWRMSSPVKRIKMKVNQDFITVDTQSGSFYTLWKNRQGLRMSNAGIYNELKDRFGDSIEIVEL
jgi:hypothetical protein